MSNDILVTVGADITNFSRNFSKATKEMQSFGKNISGITSAITNVGSTLTKAITAPAVAATTALTGLTLVKGYGRLIGIDTARAKLTALGHDAESVEVIMTSALDSVSGTAYGLDEAATAAASAVAAGIKPGKDLTKYLSLAGDAAAIAGTDFNEMGRIFNLVQTAQRAYTGELNMLADRGIPIYQWLADEAKVSAEEVREMASSGEVSAEMFRKAIDKNIGGAAQTIGEQSFAAALRNIGSDIARIGANFLDAGGEAGGFFSTVKPMLKDFRGVLSSVEDRASELGRKFGESFNRMIERIKALKSWYDGLHPLMQGFVKTLATMSAVAAVTAGPALLLLGKGLGFVFTTLPGLIKGFKEITPILKGAVGVFKTVGTTLLRFAGPIGIAVTAVLLLASVIKKYWEPIKEFSVNLWRSVTDAFKNGFSTIDQATNGWVSRILDVYKGWYKSAVDIFKRFWDYAKDTFSNALDFLHGLITIDFDKIVGAIRSQMQDTQKLLSDIWTTIKENVVTKLAEMVEAGRKKFVEFKDAAVEKLTEMGTSVIEWFAAMPDKIREKLEVWRTSISEWFEGMPDLIIQKLEGWRDAMTEWTEKQNEENIRQFGEWRDSIGEWFASIPEQIGQWLESWWTRISDWFTTTKERIKTKLGEWKDAISEWFSTRPAEIGEHLSNWWTKMGEWFSEIPSRISAKLEEWWTAIKEWFKNVPNKPEIKDAGKKMVDKVSEGNNEKRNDFVTKLGRLIIDVAKAALAMAFVALFAAGREIIRDIIEGVTNMRDSLKRKALEVVQNAANAIRDIDLREIGKNIIQGLINGIGDMADAVWNKAKEIASGIGNSIKNALGIKSPSRVTMKLGEYIGQGLANGITTTARLVSRASELMAQAAVPEVDLNYATPSGIRSSLSSAVHGTVSVNGDGETNSLLREMSGKLDRLGQMVIEMDGERVGRAVRPHVNEGNAVDANVRRYFD